MKRRRFVAQMLALGGGLVALRGVHARSYLTVEQAQSLIWPNQRLARVSVNLTVAQKKAITAASAVRVLGVSVDAWRTAGGDWFILDEVIGKHENIDIAVGITVDGHIQGIEILEYRETYGDQVRNPKWRAQFHGRNHSEHLVLNRQIKNISGATLSCRHITDGVNRLLHTWNLVLRQQ